MAMPNRSVNLAKIRELTSVLRHPWEIEVDHPERLSSSGCIVALNRLSVIDHLLLAGSLGRAVTIVTESGIGKLPHGSQRVRWNDPGVEESLVAALENGKTVVFFPEGEKSNDRWVHRGYPQFAALAVCAGVPIVPAALVALNRRDLRPEFRYRICIGEAVSTERFGHGRSADEKFDGFVLRGLTDLVMTEICQLSGRGYVDSYVEQQYHSDASEADSSWFALDRTRVERRKARERRRQEEAELARLLDQEEFEILDGAAEAARLHAEHAAQAEEQARRLRRMRGAHTDSAG